MSILSAYASSFGLVFNILPSLFGSRVHNIFPSKRLQELQDKESPCVRPRLVLNSSKISFLILKELMMLLKVSSQSCLQKLRVLTVFMRRLFKLPHSRALHHLFHRHRLKIRVRHLLVLYFRYYSAGWSNVPFIYSVYFGHQSLDNLSGFYKYNFRHIFSKNSCVSKLFKFFLLTHLGLLLFLSAHRFCFPLQLLVSIPSLFSLH